jgi:subtilase family serine protease
MQVESNRVESLEARCLLSASLKHAEPVMVPNYELAPAYVGTAPAAMTPAQVRRAYGFDNVSLGSIQGDGRGQTIAIVDAFDDTAIASDLAVFSTTFGLPAMDGLNGNPKFTVVKQPQPKPGKKYAMPTNDPSWSVEAALDVEWAHAIAPRANIILFEAMSTSAADMYRMVDAARNTAGVSVVSMSFSTRAEFADEASYDFHFTTPAGHTPVTFVACTNDWGAPAVYPASSPNVVAVGGTSLTVDASGNYLSESAWTGSGGGVSVYEPAPWYQSSLGFAGRATPDIAYNGAGESAVSVYDSIPTSTGNSGWIKVWGTSAGAPQVSAMIAIANQGRALAGKPALESQQTLGILYAAPSTDFHDVVTGASAGTPSYEATVGYDLATGRGSPFSDLLINDLLA